MKLPWSVNRKSPYTEIGIQRLKCIRCGEGAEYQWQICADGNNWRPVCGECDILLNKVVLRFMRHPHTNQLINDYRGRPQKEHPLNRNRPLQA